MFQVPNCWNLTAGSAFYTVHTRDLLACHLQNQSVMTEGTSIHFSCLQSVVHSES